MSIHDISLKLAEDLSMQTGQNKEVLSYGLEITLDAIIKILLLGVISYFADIFKACMTILVISAMLRIFSGGAHCSSYRRCLISGLISFILLGYVSTNVYNHFSNKLFICFSLFVLIFVLTVIKIWVPGANENRTIADKKRRIKFKIYSITVALICFLIAFGLYFLNYSLISISILFGLLWQMISVTPYGYSIIHFFDKSLKKMNL